MCLGGLLCRILACEEIADTNEKIYHRGSTRPSEARLKDFDRGNTTFKLTLNSQLRDNFQNQAQLQHIHFNV